MSQIPSSILNEYLQYGFDELLIKEAWKKCNGQLPKLLDTIDDIKTENQKLLNQFADNTGRLQPKGDEDEQLNQVIMESYQTAKSQNIQNFEPLNPEQRKRKNGVPVGLKNIGNTCYFNSLLQTYFMISQFVKKILQFDSTQQMEIEDDKQNPNLKKKLQDSVDLVKKLRKLFAQMILSDKKYVDPSDVINSIKDDQGQPLPIGDQKDIGEFMLYFLSRLDEGLSSKEYLKLSKQKDQALQEDNQVLNFSPSRNFNRSLSIRDDDIINEIFFGLYEVSMEYPLNEGEEIKKVEQDERFNTIFLEVQHKNLYYAWDHFNYTTIEDFKNDRGNLVNAQKTNSIKRSPSCLLFQLQRVVYDQEKQMIKKLNDHFHFEKEIYIDRFLKSNQTQYKKIREEVKKHQNRLFQLEETIAKMDKYNSAAALNEILEQTTNFLNGLSTQGQNEFGLPRNDITPQNLDNAVSVVRQAQQKLAAKRAELTKEIAQLNQTIEQSYHGLKSKKYLLQSILIHDGPHADSGHYYSYICDHNQNIWRKYNDINITEVTEEEVMQNSLGGHNNSSAYCLIYIEEERIVSENRLNLPLRLYQISENHEKQDLYSSIVPESLRNEMLTENQNFKQEILNYQANNIISVVIDSYTLRFQQTNELARKHKEIIQTNKNHPPPLISFQIHLKLSVANKNEQLENLIKWNILDGCIRQFHPNKLSLQDLQKKDHFFYDKLSQSLKKLGNFKSPSSLDISRKEEEILSQQQGEYLRLLHASQISIYMMENMISQKISYTLSSLDYLCNIVKTLDNDWFFRLARDTKYVILIHSLLEIEQTIRNNSGKPDEQTLQLLHILQAFSVMHFSENTKFITNVVCWLQDIESLSTQHQGVISDLKIKLKNLQASEQGKAFINQRDEELDKRINLVTSENDSTQWNLNKKEDVLFQDLNSNFEKIKNLIKNANTIYKRMNESMIPLMQSDRKI